MSFITKGLRKIGETIGNKAQMVGEFLGHNYLKLKDKYTELKKSSPVAKEIFDVVENVVQDAVPYLSKVESVADDFSRKITGKKK